MMFGIVVYADCQDYTNNVCWHFQFQLLVASQGLHVAYVFALYAGIYMPCDHFSDLYNYMQCSRMTDDVFSLD